MKLKKRNKKSRLHGRKTCGYGARKRHRGSGHKGGKGMAGTGKRADQKKTMILRKGEQYFGKHGFKSLRQIKIKKPKIINLQNINEDLDNYIKKGIAKKIPAGIEINLEGYKILGEGEIKEKLIIKASSASKQTKEKIEKAGGKIIFKQEENKK